MRPDVDRDFFMNAIDLLLGRNSAPRVCEPAPSAQELDTLFQAAVRAPDHGRLRPWRFLTISGEARSKLAEVFVEALLQRNPASTEAEQDKARTSPFRAPLLVVVVAKQLEDPKVPAVEQLLSAGCAAHSILLAAQAMGYGGVWRTGDNAFDGTVMRHLGLASDEVIVGFLYIGTPARAYKPLPVLALEDYVQQWP
tara:strand:- start:3756 stop:4343 length:588 start_codon:yes stop_codon:yes gene_type:complete